MKLAVILFNLGGPDGLDAVQPFLTNLFSDPAIISVPGFLRWPLARLIANRRGPVAREIYAKIGGSSPLLAETQAQAGALEAVLGRRGRHVRSFVSMRYWKPFAIDVVRAVKNWGPERIVLLPLYPQFSTTTTASSLADWNRAAKVAGLTVPASRVCCYPWQDGFVAAETRLLREALERCSAGLNYRVLFSAHGLPKRTVTRGDPYVWQVEGTAAAIVEALGTPMLDHIVCYQSRVGPLEWVGPETDAEILRAGREGKGVILVPIAFVSEHSETLVELDIDYAQRAREAGVPDYLRVPTVGAAPEFIEGLADLVEAAVDSSAPTTCGAGRICPAEWGGCGYGGDV